MKTFIYVFIFFISIIQIKCLFRYDFRTQCPILHIEPCEENLYRCHIDSNGVQSYQYCNYLELNGIKQTYWSTISECKEICSVFFEGCIPKDTFDGMRPEVIAEFL